MRRSDISYKKNQDIARKLNKSNHTTLLKNKTHGESQLPLTHCNGITNFNVRQLNMGSLVQIFLKYRPPI